jgi:hypothetical protein
MRKALAATEVGWLTYRKRNRRSSPYSGTPNTTPASPSSTDESGPKVPTEWRLLMMSQSFGKLYRHQLDATGA